MEKAEHIWSQCRPAGVGAFEVTQAKMVFDFLKHHPIGEIVFQFGYAADRFFAEAHVGCFVTDSHRPFVHKLFAAGAVFNFNKHLADQVFPNAGWTEHGVGSNFADVGLGSLW